MRARGMGFRAINDALQATNEEQCEEALTESEVEGIAKSISNYPPGEISIKYNYIGSKKAPPAPVLAKELMSDSRFIFMAEALSVYQDGYYQKGGELYIKKRLQELLGSKYRSQVAEEVVKYIEVATHKDSTTFQEQGEFVNVKNGLFRWSTSELIQHNPDIVSFTQIPVHYDPDVSCPNIDKYFETTLPEDCISLVEELFGYCTIPDVRYQKAFMLTGEGATGKSTFISLLESFLGSENVSKIPLQELDEHRFKRAGLQRKLANVFADLDQRALKGTSYFKTIVAGDAIDAEMKYKNPFYFKPHVKLIYSANQIPYTPDQSDAFYRRWIIIPFPNKFEEDKADLDILGKLTTPQELSGLLNRALYGLDRLMNKVRFSEVHSIDKAMEDYKRASDNVYAFLCENTRTDSKYSVEKNQLYLAYRNWCEESGLKPVSRQRFNKGVQKTCNANEWRKDGKIRCWKGVKLIEQDFS
jgi:putative DNA primase/helicase